MENSSFVWEREEKETSSSPVTENDDSLWKNSSWRAVLGRISQCEKWSYEKERNRDSLKIPRPEGCKDASTLYIICIINIPRKEWAFILNRVDSHCNEKKKIITEYNRTYCYKSYMHNHMYYSCRRIKIWTENDESYILQYEISTNASSKNK